MSRKRTLEESMDNQESLDTSPEAIRDAIEKLNESLQSPTKKPKTTDTTDAPRPDWTKTPRPHPSPLKDFLKLVLGLDELKLKMDEDLVEFLKKLLETNEEHINQISSNPANQSPLITIVAAVYLQAHDALHQNYSGSHQKATDAFEAVKEIGNSQQSFSNLDAKHFEALGFNKDEFLKNIAPDAQFQTLTAAYSAKTENLSDNYAEQSAALSNAFKTAQDALMKFAPALAASAGLEDGASPTALVPKPPKPE